MSHLGSAEDRAVAAFEDRHGTPPEYVASAPGRVNLIGEHTDYNEGFVLPMALPLATAIAARPRPDRTVEVWSEGFGEQAFDVDGDPLAAGWARYLAGMGSVLAAAGTPVGGWEGTIATDIPHGASLSSSAALEIAAGLVFDADRQALTARQLAIRARAVENDVLGLPSGIMDQLISAIGVAGSALLIDCRDLSARPVPIPVGATIVVLDTGTRRRLVDSAYEDRQATCARVAVALGVGWLRDATPADLDRLDPADVGHRRARHVLAENQRTLDAADALADGDLAETGRLMAASHASLRDDYEVSGPALDAVVEVAADSPGCFGARMTGGGFAGCAVALVAAGAVEAFCASVAECFEAPAEQPAEHPLRLYPVRPGPGATLRRLSGAAG
jgi:galactokinase